MNGHGILFMECTITPYRMSSTFSCSFFFLFLSRYVLAVDNLTPFIYRAGLWKSRIFIQINLVLFYLQLLLYAEKYDFNLNPWRAVGLRFTVMSHRWNYLLLIKMSTTHISIFIPHCFAKRKWASIMSADGWLQKGWFRTVNNFLEDQWRISCSQPTRGSVK